MEGQGNLHAAQPGTAYWYEVYYYDDRQTIDVVYYWLGLLACLLRTAAWARRREALPRPAW